MNASYRRASLALVAGTLAAALGTLPALAQEYPTHEIHAVCSFAAGSGADILVRYYSDKLAKLSGRPVIVENRAGALGVIGTDYAAKAKPDGYTILVAPISSTLAAAPFLFKKLPYDPLKDFTAVAPISSLNFVVAVSGTSSIKSIAELVSYLKSKPDQGSYGIANNTGQVTGELSNEMTGLSTLYVPYTHATSALTDTISGEVDFMTYDITFLLPQARSGRVRILAVTSAARLTTLPDVPTMAESGFPGYDLAPWWGVVVPAGTPKPIVDKLAAWFNQITASEETHRFLENLATDPFPGSPESMAALIRTEIEQWGRYVRLAKIEPQ